MTDVEAPLRAATMARLRPWFEVWEEVPVTLRDGGRGRVDVLAAPRDPRFSRFVFAIEEKKRPKPSADLAKRIKQAADYVGALPDTGGPSICMSFVDISHSVFYNDTERAEVRWMLNVGHQFRVGSVALDTRGFIVLSCGPDDVWRERPFAETGEHWPGRALERLTNARQRGGIRA